MMDEVSRNTSQKGDGYIGSKVLVYAQGMVPHIKVNTKDKRWTILRLTALKGDPVMGIVIFAGKREQAIMETGTDIFTDQL